MDSELVVPSCNSAVLVHCGRGNAEVARMDPEVAMPSCNFAVLVDSE